MDVTPQMIAACKTVNDNLRKVFIPADRALYLLKRDKQTKTFSTDYSSPYRRVVCGI